MDPSYFAAERFVQACLRGDHGPAHRAAAIRAQRAALAAKQGLHPSTQARTIRCLVNARGGW